MLTNPKRIYSGVPPGSIHEYKLRLYSRHLLEPIASQFNVTVTSGYRTLADQADLRDAAGNLIPVANKAKGVSQHCLGEAGDWTADFILRAFMWAIDNLQPWVLILYYKAGKPTHVHMAMLPERPDPRGQRYLLNIDGAYSVFNGEFPS